jgi:oxygen-independent coproporphyrinogen-3 oxidase
LAAFKRNGINRLSFGLQSTEPALLQVLNRQHNFENFLDSYGRARRLGFGNINVDLMFGLPGQTETDWRNTLNKVIALGPEHISAYALKVEEGTKFKKSSVQPDEDEEASQYLMASQILAEAGYVHYEISNFARPGFESSHNLKYWKNEETLGLGVSSASYLHGRRFKNTSSLTLYFSALSKNYLPIVEETKLGPEESRSEKAMLALRLKDGAPLEDLPSIPVPKLEHFVSQGYAKISEGRYRLTPQGWLLSNQLFQHLV